MNLQLERFCDLLSADDFRALARAFPAVQTIYIPSKRRSAIAKFEAAIGVEKTALLIENWAGLTMTIPTAYLRSPLAKPEQLFIELVKNNRPILEIAEDYQLHPLQIIQLVNDEARRQRDLEICKNWRINESTRQLCARLGTNPDQIRKIAHAKRPTLGVGEPREAQLSLFIAG